MISKQTSGEKRPTSNYYIYIYMSAFIYIKLYCSVIAHIMIPNEKVNIQIRLRPHDLCACVWTLALLWQSHETILWFRL